MEPEIFHLCAYSLSFIAVCFGLLCMFIHFPHGVTGFKRRILSASAQKKESSHFLQVEDSLLFRSTNFNGSVNPVAKGNN